MTATEDSTQLRKIQLAATAALKEFDRICTLLGTRYVIYGGTAIGAARHQGFIPWDDDVDVCMPREDYERFLAEAPAVIAPAFEVISSGSHPDYPRTFGVLGLVGSTFVPGVARNRSFRMPLGIDLFPLDPIPDDPKAFRRQARATWVWGRLLFLLGTPTPDIPLRAPLKQVASSIMHSTGEALDPAAPLGARRAQVRGKRLQQAGRLLNAGPGALVGVTGGALPRQARPLRGHHSHDGAR